jgi:hypothetical protein
MPSEVHGLDNGIGMIIMDTDGTVP